MITVRTYLAPDQYGGVGLFADEDIPKGHILWRFDPRFTEVYMLDEYKAAIAGDDDKARILKKYAYPCPIVKDGHVVKALFHDIDNGSYINHDDHANAGDIYAPDHPLYAQSIDVNIALRDIKRGEQITNNYYDFDEGFEITRQAENCVTFLLKRESAAI